MESEFGNQADGRAPIIAMTAYALDVDRERRLEAGMDDNVPKPIKVHLLAVLAKWVKSGVRDWPAAPGRPRGHPARDRPRRTGAARKTAGRRHGIQFSGMRSGDRISTALDGSLIRPKSIGYDRRLNSLELIHCFLDPESVPNFGGVDSPITNL